MKKCAVVFLFALASALCAFSEDANVSPVSIPGKNTWPATAIPSVIPEYKGKVVNYGNGGETNWFQIYVAETNPGSVADYVQLYRNAGWTVTKDGSSDKAAKDQYQVLITFHQPQQMVGITISIGRADKQWPVGEFPEVPQFTACLSSDFTKNEYDWTIGIQKAKDEDMAAYRRLLVTMGWAGDPEGTEFFWSKTAPTITLQLNDQGDGVWYFSVSKE